MITSVLISAPAASRSAHTRVSPIASLGGQKNLLAAAPRRRPDHVGYLLDGHDCGREVDGQLVGVGERPGGGVYVDHGHGGAPSAGPGRLAWRVRGWGCRHPVMLLSRHRFRPRP